MRLLAFYLGIHDSNPCFYDTDNASFKYIKSERRCGVKRHRADLSFVIDCCREYNFSPDIVGFSDGDRNGLGSCPTSSPVVELPEGSRPTLEKARWFNVDHHLAHILSVWPLVQTEDLDYGIAIDGRGDHERRVSIFRRPARLDSPFFTSTKSTKYRICHLFDLIGKRMGLSGHVADFAGKIMGAKAYGEVDESFVDACLRRNVHMDLFSLVSSLKSSDADSIFFRFENPQFRNWLAGVHTTLERIVLGLFEENIPLNSKVAYSGGCALNTVMNEELSKRYTALTIPPHCYDGGLSLGCIEAVRILTGCEKIYLAGFPFVQEDEDMGYASRQTINMAAKDLAKGLTVGWLQGRGEIGPRALGHRSLLFNPSIVGGKDAINRVKFREDWRPFAPSVLHAYQDEYFDTSEYLAFMLRAVRSRRERAATIPSVIHVDGTSRIQSVDAHRSELLRTFHELLSTFYVLTGTPLVLNTSYNAGGKPIAGTRVEAIDFFWASAIDVLVIGDEILRKTDER